MDQEQRKISTTTDGQPPAPGFETASAPQPVRADGQHGAYWVLSEEVRAKGFVRPVRYSYEHVGRLICGAPSVIHKQGVWVCSQEPGHTAECGRVSCEIKPDAKLVAVTQPLIGFRLGGCGTVTRMGHAIAETYARDPKFYGSTFCVHCGEHLPVSYFVWDGTDEAVGS